MDDESFKTIHPKDAERWHGTPKLHITASRDNGHFGTKSVSPGYKLAGNENLQMLVTLQPDYPSLSLQHDTLSLAQNHVAALLPDYSEMMVEVHNENPEFCLTKEARFLGKNRDKFDPTMEPDTTTKKCLLCHEEVRDMYEHRKTRKHNMKKEDYPAQQIGHSPCPTCMLVKRIDGEERREFKEGLKAQAHHRQCRHMYEKNIRCPFCLQAPIHW